jgi:hypothetical protein
MKRISLEFPGLIAVRTRSARLPPAQHSGHSGNRMVFRLTLRAEQLERRTMLDASMLAKLPDLVAFSDTGESSVDNLTYDRTPSLSGSVRGAASQIRLLIDGRRVALLPVTNRTWTYTVPVEEALAAGKHRIVVQPIDASGKAGKRSKPLGVTIVTESPAVPTLRLAGSSDTGEKGDGQTIRSRPTFRGIAQSGQWVSVSIDGVFAGRVRTHERSGTWSLKAPRLANGSHEVTATAANRAGLESAATSFDVTVNGPRTVMLDASRERTVELMASHILGRNAQGFVVTKVHGGTLQKWSADRNAWRTIPAAAYGGRLRSAPPNRTISFTDVVRWTPYSGAEGLVAAFEVIPLDKPGGPIAPVPQAGTVPGNVVDPQIDRTEGARNSIAWGAPIDGCGCPSTRYSIEVTHEDGRMRVYNVHSAVQGISTAEGGAVKSAVFWAATETGAGETVIANAEISLKKVTIVIRHGNDVQLEQKPFNGWSNWTDPNRITNQAAFQDPEKNWEATAETYGSGPDKYTQFQQHHPEWNPRTVNYPAVGDTTFISSITANYLPKNGAPSGLELPESTSLSDIGWKEAVSYETVLPNLVNDLNIAPISRIMADSYWRPNGYGTSNPIDTVLPFIDANKDEITIDLVVKQDPRDSDEKAWQAYAETRLMPGDGDGSVVIVSTVQGLWNTAKQGAGLGKGFILDALIDKYLPVKVVNGDKSLEVDRLRTDDTYRPEKGSTIYVFGDLDGEDGNELYIYHQDYSNKTYQPGYES